MPENATKETKADLSNYRGFTSKQELVTKIDLAIQNGQSHAHDAELKRMLDATRFALLDE